MTDPKEEKVEEEELNNCFLCGLRCSNLYCEDCQIDIENGENYYH